MATDSDWVPQIALAIGAALVVLGAAFGYRRPRDYGSSEIARGADNPTVTTIARNDLIAISFFENGARVAKAKYWGQGDKGIALKLDGDETEYLITSGNDWFEETRFKIKRDIRLMLLANGTPIVTAERLPDALGGWQKDKDGNYTKAYDIDCAGGRFGLFRVARAKFALRQGKTVLGIAAMPLPTGAFSRLKSRIEFPAALPLATRLFLALLVDIEDRERSDSTST